MLLLLLWVLLLLQPHHQNIFGLDVFATPDLPAILVTLLGIASAVAIGTGSYGHVMAHAVSAGAVSLFIMLYSYNDASMSSCNGHAGPLHFVDSQMLSHFYLCT